MNEKIVSLIKKCFCAFAIMGSATALILALREHSASDSLATKYLNLADAFTIPSVVMLMLGILVWISTTGSFDTLGFAFSKAKHSFIPTAEYKHERFYDYKMRKEKKRLKGYSFMFICGGIYLIPGVVFSILFNFA